MRTNWQLARRPRTALIFTAALSLSIQSQAALSNDLSSAAAHYEAGNYAAALPLAHQEAQGRNASGQLLLGLMYDLGRGTRENDVEAVRWYLAAAEQGNARAQQKLGLKYDLGRGTPENDIEAVRWYLASAKQGNARAQYYLGVMHDFGRGTPKNKAEAIRWYLASAKQGYATAQYHLGAMHEFGTGTPENDDEAVRWYLASAKQGYANAQHRLSAMYEYGEGVTFNEIDAYLWSSLAKAGGHSRADKRLAKLKPKMTTEQLAQVQARAAAFTLEFSSNIQSLSAFSDDYSDALTHYNADSYASAFPLMSQLARGGDAAAQYYLGLMYDFGTGTLENDAEAVRWYHAGADQGNVLAQYNLARKYDLGRGTPKNDTEAVRWYRDAADQGHTGAQHNLGVMYAFGKGVPVNAIQAYVWTSLAKAGAGAHQNAEKNLAELRLRMTQEQIAEAQASAATLWGLLPRH